MMHYCEGEDLLKPPNHSDMQRCLGYKTSFSTSAQRCNDDGKRVSVFGQLNAHPR